MLFALWTYYGALHGEFVFDDVPAVKDNFALEKIGGFWEAAYGPKHSPVSNRPLVTLTLALNYAAGGLNTFGYHLVNLAIHCLNAALVFGVVRRMLAAPNLGNAYDEIRATWTAVALATLWAVHPLGTEAVVYVTQRTTLLMSTFLLLTLYATLRSISDLRRGRIWKMAAVAACAGAMLSKEEAVALPILVVLFERAYHFGSFAEAWERRRNFYLCLAATWLLLLFTVLVGKSHNQTVGYSTHPPANAWEWLLTEAPAIVRYVRLTFFPFEISELNGGRLMFTPSYDWPIERGLGDAWFLVDGSPVPVFLACFIVVALLAASAALWFWKPHWGWLGAWFFLLLAPTSSILPIISEIIAERRMYLPMLSLLAPVVIGVMRFGDWLLRGATRDAKYAGAFAAVPIGIVAFALSFATAAYARVFETEGSLWDEVAKKNAMTNGSFMSGQCLLGHAKVLLDRKRHDLAIPELERALAGEAPSIDVYFNLAAAYVDVGRFADAERIYNVAFSLESNHATGLRNYANLMVALYQKEVPEKQLGAADMRLVKALDAVNRSLKLNPRSLEAWNVLGSTCVLMDRPQEAQVAWANALKLDPGNISVQTNQAAALARAGKKTEALAKLEAVLKANPKNIDLLIKAANAYNDLGDQAGALARLKQAQELEPNNVIVRAMIEQLQKSGG